MAKKDGGQAFPLPHGTCDRPLGDEREGMSLRDYFASKAMQSLVGGKGWVEEMTILVKRAYEIADVMLVERAK